MSKTRAAFFTNPLSHSVSKRGSVLERSGQDHDVLRYRLDKFECVMTLVGQAANDGANMIFIEGGDGTIQGVLTEVLSQQDKFKKTPDIVLLSGGMTNLVATNIGIKNPTKHKIDTILANPGATKRTSLPLLSVKLEGNGQEHFGFLFSTGALPAATVYCLDKIHTKGIGGAAAVRTTMLNVLLGRGKDREKILSATPLKLDLKDKQIEGGHLTSVATTLPKLMIGINPFWGAEDAPVRLTYAGPDVKHKVRNIARMFKKTQSEKAQQALRAGGFESWNIDGATLEHDGPMVLDGEILPDTKGVLKLSASKPLIFLS